MSPFFKNIRNKAINHKTLIQNFSYLSALQIFNLILPLITYPYLIRVLGKETYGLVVFAQAIVAYLVILVGFGFNISATRVISINRNNKEKLSEIVSCVLIIKSLLLGIAIVVLCILLLIIPEANGYKTLFILSLWACVYDALFPIWYFQGIEQMKYITYINLASRLTFLGLIFLFIGSSDDYLFVPIIYGIGAFFAGLTAQYILFIKHRIQFKWQPIDKLKYYIKDSMPIFISNVSISLYVGTNKVVTGTLLGMSEVAYYDLAEKIISILKTPTGIISQALFPKTSKDKDKKFIKRLFFLTLAFNILIYLFILISAKIVVLILGGTNMYEAIYIIRILGLTIPLISMSIFFGVQLLIPFGYQKVYTRIIISSGIVYFISIFLLYIFKNIGLIQITLLTVTIELYITIRSYYCCRKFKLF